MAAVPLASPAIDPNAKSDNVLPPGAYTISSVKTKGLIEVNSDGKTISCWSANGSAEHQHWYVRHAPGGGFTINNVKYSNLYLALPKPPEPWNGWLVSSTEPTRWDIEYRPDGRKQLQKYAIWPQGQDKKKVVDLYKGLDKDGTQISLATDYTYDQQRWQFDPRPSPIKLDDPELEFKKALDACKADKERLERDLTELRKHDAELQKDLAELRKHDAELQKELAAARKHGEEVELQLTAEKARNAELEKDLVAAKQHDVEDEKRLADAKKHDEQDEKKLADSKKNIAELEKSLAAAKKHDEEDEKKLAAAKKHDEEDEKKLAASKKNIAELEKMLAAAKKHDEEDEKQLALTKKRVEQLEKSLDEARKHDTKDEKMLAALRNELALCKALVEKLQVQLTASVKLVLQLEGELNYWKRREEDASKESSYWKRCFKALDKEVEAFHARVDSLRHWFSRVGGGAEDPPLVREGPQLPPASLVLN